MKQGIIAVLFACSLSACAVHHVTPAPPPSDDATIKLAEAATSVSKSLHELARIQAAATVPLAKLADPADFGIRGVASIDWVGPVGPLLERLAKASHFTLRVLGRPPAVPIIVTIDAKDAPLADLIQDIDFQVTGKASVKVYPNSQVIELSYAHM